MADIVLAGVSKRYPDGVVAVERMDLEVADGEFLILVGPSGCGKSTTLNMIAGLEEITEGELRIAGEVVNEKPPRERDIAMVFQNYALYPHFTVRENLAFPLEMAKLAPATIAARVAETAEMLQLTEHLDRKPAKLSGGQRQRVAMGRAIVREPRAFLMDEPLSNLDAKLRVRMRTQIARLQKRLGTTTVYVTHDQSEAMTLGDRVVVMRGGRVQQVGTPRELYEQPANLFVAGFIGSPAMNFLAATPKGDRLDTAIGEIALTDEQRKDVLACGLRGGELVVGLRPEAVEVAVEEAASAAADPSEPGVTFNASVDVLESTGSDLYAYFEVGGPTIGSTEFEELAADAERIGDGGGQIVARLRPETRAHEGEVLDLRIASRKLYAFDVTSGERVF